MNRKLKSTVTGMVLMTLAACGGGGGGGGGGSSSSGGGSTSVLYYPYETVYGDVCSTQEPTPGCTFYKADGQRIKVSEDTDYGKNGNGSDDMWYVKFDSSGNAAVYDQYGNYKYNADPQDFAGYVGGTTIGVGTTGLYWENISSGTYWLGKNGVLYNANQGETNYGEAINDKSSSKASDSNFAALNSETNKKLVDFASKKLMKDYGFQKDKAVAVASALNSWAVASAERGLTTPKDMDKTFKSVFGVKFADALAAVKDLQGGSTAGMADMTNRSAAALGLKPHEAQKFIKGMYRKALANWGYDVDQVNW